MSALAAQKPAPIYLSRGLLAVAPRRAPSRFQLLLGSLRFWCLLSIAGAGALAWQDRFTMNPDGVVYLDMAQAAIRGGPAHLINTSWGALYPFLLALLILVFDPGPASEFPLTHLLNWILFCASSASFAFFLRQFLGERSPPRRRLLVPFAFVVYYYFFTQFAPLALVSPDLCASAILFAAAGMVCRLCKPEASWRDSVLLGVLLALGYPARVAMVGISLLLLATLYCLPPKRYIRRQIILAAAVFAACCAPLVLLVSAKAGHFTLSESGNLNYLWHVNRVPRALPAGALPHAQRVLVESPLALEFDSIPGGTYPFQYDPAHWYAGLTPRFDWKQQFAAIHDNLQVCETLALQMGGLLTGIVLLVSLSLRPANRRVNRRWLWIVLWSVGASASLCLVHVEARYLVPFIVLFWIALYAHAPRLQDARIERAVWIVALGSFLPAIVLGSGGAMIRSLLRPQLANRSDALVVAATLNRKGLHSGDRIAVVGDAFRAYYAHLAKARIEVQIPEAESFWGAAPGDLRIVRDRLAAAGIRAVVAESKPAWFEQGDWEEVPGTLASHYAILMLPPGNAGSRGGT